jgi:hypothetical protein
MKLFLDRNQKLPHFVTCPDFRTACLLPCSNDLAGQPSGDGYSSETM